MSKRHESIDELLSLAGALLDGSATSGQTARLQALVVADPELRREYIRLTHQEADLIRTGRASMQSPDLATAADGVHGENSPMHANRTTTTHRRRWLSASVAAAAILLLALGVIAWRQTGESADAVVVLTEWQGPIMLRDADGESRSPTRSMPLSTSMTVATQAADAWATIRFAEDGTAVRLLGGTETKLLENASRRIELHRGAVVCDVSPQPAGRPMQLTTPHAVATVLGTQFTLLVEEAGTRLAVAKGMVQLADRTTGQAAPVEGGWIGQAAAGAPPLVLRQTPGPRLPGDVDFEVPAPVRETIGRELGEIAVDALSKHTDEGRTVFETDSKVGGMEIDLAIGDDGKVLEKEVEISLPSAPPAVRKKIETERAGNHLILEQLIRSSDTNGNVTHYRAWLRDGSHEVKLRIAPDGKLRERRERNER